MDVAVLIWAVALTILAVVGIVWVLDLQARLGRLQRHQEKQLTVEEGDAGLAVALQKLAAQLSETTARTERLVVRTGSDDGSSESGREA